MMTPRWWRWSRNMPKPVDQRSFERLDASKHGDTRFENCGAGVVRQN